MESINERVLQIRALFCKGNNQLFADKLGVGKQAASNYVRDGYPIGRSVQDRILNAFPDISRGWLLSGEGEMLKQLPESGVILHNIGDGNIANVGNGSIANIGNKRQVRQVQNNDPEKIKELELLLIEKDAEIKSLKYTIEMLIQSLKK